MAEILFENVNKEYDDNVIAVKDFNLSIKDKEFIVFVGPSGCGKSTTLQMIAGLDEVTKGSIYINGKRINDLPSKDRDIAMVFQNYALYPHFTVYENMAIGLKLRKMKKEIIDQRVKHAATILGLENYLERKPKALSGGQRQRVALGRAMVRDARVFLMDEPLSNLDAKLRVQMRSVITKLHKTLQTTTIYVTHDQTEAMTMATRIVVMKDGVIQQVDSPKEIYDNPENVFVGSFIGTPPMNFITGIIEDEKIKIEFASFPITEEKLSTLRKNEYQHEKVILGIRPENISLSTKHDVIIPVKVNLSELLGSEIVLHSEIDGQTVIVREEADYNINIGEVITVGFDFKDVHFFDIETSRRIK
ncbi:ABC transporter ATP-binding protein [Oceanobacillus sp. CF4.6]|uniref:ABC transporter ATP-binding protein n=1 Tax=Oceanobacillus sp. CF4.6 TaxID=3373080 RepID=UPI003EE4554A